MTQDITFPDPARNVAFNDLSTLWINVYDTLVMRQPDGSLGPWLAESWETPSGHRVGIHVGAGRDVPQWRVRSTPRR